MYTADGDFIYGPVDADRHAKAQGMFDGVLGFFDGVSNVANSIERTSGSVARTRINLAEGQSAADDVRLTRAERELDMLLEAQKVNRGDNVTALYVAGAVALGAIVIFSN